MFIEFVELFLNFHFLNAFIGAILRQLKILPSVEPLVIDIFFPMISSPDMIGIWQVSIIKADKEKVLALLNFLVLLSNEEQMSNIHYLKIMTNFWSVSNMCSTTANSSLCPDLSNRTMATKIIAINDCFEQRWSSFFLDIKSDW